MLFTIDVIGLVDTEFRLKKDGSFKKFTENNSKIIQADDYIFEDYYKAFEWLDNKKTAEVDGKIIPVNPEVSDLLDPCFEVRPHRNGKPKKDYFTREELCNLLLKGDDSIDNSLVIDFDGYLHLVPFSVAIDGPFAVRHETFIAGNGYVGSHDSIENIDDLYLSLLEYWLHHLRSDEMEYCDSPSTIGERELLNEIRSSIAEIN